MLPVSPADDRRWGNGLDEIERLGLHESFASLCAAPEFDRMPWYADHPSDPAIRQERQVLDALDEAERMHGGAKLGRCARGPLPCYLLGFSKSGWGALSVFLRHRGRFAGAVAFDAPLMQAAPDRWEMARVFGTQENFERYRVSALLAAKATALRTRPRLGLLGCDLFRDDMERAVRLLVELNVPHFASIATPRAHRWDSGWLPEAFDMVSRMEERERGQR